jgi:integrase
VNSDRHLVPVDSAQVLERITEQGSETRRKYQRKAKAANSLRTYRADLDNLAAWCRARGLASAPSPMPPELVATYLAEQYEAGSKPATVRHRAAAISWAHRCAGLDSPCDSDLVRDVLAGIGNDAVDQGRHRQKQAKGLVQRHADRIADRIADPLAGGVSLKDLRDLALLLSGRDALARANELVALQVDDVTLKDDGTGTVRLIRRKTGSDDTTYPLGADAVDAVRRWLEAMKATGITSGPLFRAISKARRDGTGGHVKDEGIGVRDVSRAIKRLAGDEYSSHSMRVGMAKDLAAADYELPAIMQAGGWKSPEMVSRYIADEEAGRMAVARYHADRAARRHK